MTTMTAVPEHQSTFEEDFRLNYPGDVRDTVGQVVGPNWLGEFFVVSEVEVVQIHTNIGRDLLCDTETKSEVKLVVMTPARKALISEENRREYITRVSSNQDRAERTPYLPSHAELVEAENYFQRGIL